MIQSLRFVNYRVLRDATLPLGPFTLLVGPNGSGKSTVLHALRSLQQVMAGKRMSINEVATLHAPGGPTSVTAYIMSDSKVFNVSAKWSLPDHSGGQWEQDSTGDCQTDHTAFKFFRDIRTYSLDEKVIVRPVALEPRIELLENGGNLAGVLDRLRDQHPEKFESYNRELAALAPEFDRVLFDTPGPGQRGFMLRTKSGQHAIPARDLSQGTVLASALLALTYLDPPPSMVCIEEPDRGIHPRLYREIQDALYRLAYPENFGLDRPPVQVLITSHSPYMLDLHKDHPEEVVIAEKAESEATFSRLSDREDLEDLLSEASLGEIWYSGVLGGVPAGT